MRNDEWFENRHFRTYALCNVIDRAVDHYFSSLTAWSDEFFGEPGPVLELVRPWQKRTALHHVCEWLIDRYLADEEVSTLYTVRGGEELQPTWLLPAEAAMLEYGMVERNDVHEVDRARLKNDTDYANFLNGYVLELRTSTPFEQLAGQLVDECFYVLFGNRRFLRNLNAILAPRTEESAMYASEYEPEYVRFFNQSGSLRRTAPPMWARRAVFYRDHGRCVRCGVDLSGVLDPMAKADYDHVVPLAEGGLNDVTNLQLLCARHNRAKGATIAVEDGPYRRWFPTQTSRHAASPEIKPRGAASNAG